jgi:hypothetical protein
VRNDIHQTTLVPDGGLISGTLISASERRQAARRAPRTPASSFTKRPPEIGGTGKQLRGFETVFIARSVRGHLSLGSPRFLGRGVSDERAVGGRRFGDGRRSDARP